MGRLDGNARFNGKRKPKPNKRKARGSGSTKSTKRNRKG